MHGVRGVLGVPGVRAVPVVLGLACVSYVSERMRLDVDCRVSGIGDCRGSGIGDWRPEFETAAAVSAGGPAGRRAGPAGRLPGQAGGPAGPWYVGWSGPSISN